MAGYAIGVADGVNTVLFLTSALDFTHLPSSALFLAVLHTRHVSTISNQFHFFSGGELEAL